MSMTDAKTKRENTKRLYALVRGYEERGNRAALVRLIGGSIDDFGDHSPADHGEAPAGAQWYPLLTY
jgi:hypothetical protein